MHALKHACCVNMQCVACACVRCVVVRNGLYPPAQEQEGSADRRYCKMTRACSSPVTLSIMAGWQAGCLSPCEVLVGVVLQTPGTAACSDGDADWHAMALS